MRSFPVLNYRLRNVFLFKVCSNLSGVSKSVVKNVRVRTYKPARYFSPIKFTVWDRFLVQSTPSSARHRTIFEYSSAENRNLRHMRKTGDSADPIDHNSQKTSYARVNTRLEKGSLSPRQRPAETCVNQPLNLLCPCMNRRRNTCAKKGWGISHPTNLERRGRGSQPAHTGGDYKYAIRTRLIVAHKISCIINPGLFHIIFSLFSTTCGFVLQSVSIFCNGQTFRQSNDSKLCIPENSIL